MDIGFLKENFLSRFGENSEQVAVFFAPGRVNIIGEHTDYNGGYVLPCALSFGTYLLIRKTGDDQLRFASENFEGTWNLRLNALGKQGKTAWVNYPLGIIDQFRKRGMNPDGFEMLYSGDIPPEAGLSSSASIELVTAFALNALFHFGMDRMELIQLSQQCEHEFIGVKCGIMDQFAVAMGRKEHAIYLNCKNLDYEEIPFKLGEYKLVIVNSNKPRGLSASAYNERVMECQEAVVNINKSLTTKDLGEITLEEFRMVEHLISHPDVKKRAYHVINENYRVKQSVHALKAHDLKLLGKLMNASHNSLRDYYEVTGPELDALAEAAWEIDGVLGARMTGAGFGGCTVNIVHRNAVEEFRKRVGEQYHKKTGLHADFYLPEIGDGVRSL
ncbi:MAG: galactokinase [Bacteroidales bacterium]|nr:galactokinase [Bacteroidales bacterium]MCF8386641.1 galactokinase [Bacteroidales bacterium]MCF8398923.1 galactokinase [Bacteroidales bacterium]